MKRIILKKVINKQKRPTHSECNHKDHPDHSKELVKLKRVAGQIEGIIGMIESRRYCPDILIQTRAAKSALQSVEHSILKTHIESCVQEAVESGDQKGIELKISELIKLIDRHV